MSAFLAFLGTFLLSLFVALLAALQLADYFGATEEFTLVLVALPAFSLFCVVVLALAAAAVRRAWLLNGIAVLLALAALSPMAWPVLLPQVEWPVPLLPASDGKSAELALEFSIPALLAILVQWGLIRRRRLRAQGDDELSLWPWFTTAVAGLAILNPVGLDMIGQALNGQAMTAPQTWGAARPWALGGAALIAMMLTEYYIRGWMRRRRLPQHPMRIGAAG